MDKDKIYCPNCNKELIKEENGNYKHDCNCYENKRKYTLQWCEKCQKFTNRQGTLKDSKCCTCAVRLQHKNMREADPEGYSKRQSAAAIKAHKFMKENNIGLYSEEVRALSEKTKRENGFYERFKEASAKWRREHPEEVRRIASIGGKALAKQNRENFTDEDWMNWVNRSCNSETANKSPESKRLNSGTKWCDKCQKETYHLNNVCIKCHPSSSQWKPSFEEINGILYYYYKTTKQYVPWNDYKAKFNRKRLTKDVESFIDSLKSLDIFQPKNMGPVGTYDLDEIIQLYPTFRTQDSENWEGVRSAFEQNLVENNIGWFVYIKFYIDQSGNIKPLVVGKSGSLNVNTNGSDVTFSTDIDHGPSRRFLIETEGAEWDKTQILIIKAKSEKQALFYERKIANVYGLFES